MSLVHIKSRITDNEKTFQDFSSSDQSNLYLADSKNCQVESFSLELTLGDGWSDRYSENETQLKSINDDGIKIARHGSVVVEVREDIKVPHNLYGILVPTGSLFLGKGILIAPSKIEPSFKGKLKLRLFNTSNEIFCLQKKVKLASAIFFSTDVTEFHNEITRASNIDKVQLSKREKILRWIKQNPPTWLGWLVSIISPIVLILIFVATYLLFYLPSIENQKKTAESQQQKTIELQQQVKVLQDNFILKKNSAR